MRLLPFALRLPGRWARRRARRARMTLQTVLFGVLLLTIIPLYIIYKPPKAVINYFQWRHPTVLFHVDVSRRLIGLTIDDAPTEYTSQILQVLKQYNATATFFVIGNQVAGREDTLRDIILNGHELGNHALRDEPSISLSSNELAVQIDIVDEYINNAYEAARVERPAKYFRPGSGVFSQRIVDVATEAGHRTILGSIYPHDPFIKFWRINAWHILSMMRSGAIIICHDRRSWTIPMLQKVLPKMVKRGYEVVSITELLEASKT